MSRPLSEGQALPGECGGGSTPRAAVPARGHVAHPPLQGEPQSLATIYQPLSQACGSAIQREWGSFLARAPRGLP